MKHSSFDLFTIPCGLWEWRNKVIFNLNLNIFGGGGITNVTWNLSLVTFLGTVTRNTFGSLIAIKAAFLAITLSCIRQMAESISHV